MTYSKLIDPNPGTQWGMYADCWGNRGGDQTTSGCVNERRSEKDLMWTQVLHLYKFLFAQ